MQIDMSAEELTLRCRILAEQDIIDAYGHLSARVPGRDDRFMISRQMAPALVTPEDFIVMTVDGEVVQSECGDLVAATLGARRPCSSADTGTSWSGVMCRAPCCVRSPSERAGGPRRDGAGRTRSLE